MADHVITCPGCRQPLRVPADAVGKPAHCPHCRTTFDLPATPDGSPAAPVLRSRGGLMLSVPRPLTGPALGLLVLGTISLVVNGMLTVLFLVKPGATMDYARNEVQGFRASSWLGELKDAGMKPKSPTADEMKARLDEEERRKAELDDAWAEAMARRALPVHAAFAPLGLVMILGGAAMVRGRYYWLAVLGCVAAFLNLNYFCCAPGAVAGGWGLLSLVRDDVKAHFRRGG